MVSTNLALQPELHVLVVDHDPNGQTELVLSLEACHYKVTLIELASAAMSLISSGNLTFDIILANVNSPDLCGFKLVQLAFSIQLPIILMSSDENPFKAEMALRLGALLLVQKPLSFDFLKYIWQLVVSEKSKNNVQMLCQRHRNGEINPNGMMRTNKNLSEGNEKRRACIEWTNELHAKFMEAVDQLGEGRCFPKEILKLMNVPGLTRMQVASHLQKCRRQLRYGPGPGPAEPRRRPAGASPWVDPDPNNPGHQQGLDIHHLDLNLV